MPYTYKYPRPAVTVDALVLSSDDKVLLIKRKNPPFENHWALPGGFIDINETPEQAVHRELHEETGLSGLVFCQFHTYGALDRDPRHRTITIVFLAKTGSSSSTTLHANDDAADACWFDVYHLPPIAFDHQSIINDYLQDKYSC